VIHAIAFILLGLVFALVVLAPLPPIGEDLGYTLDPYPDPPEPEPDPYPEPDDARPLPVRFSGYTPAERRWGGVRVLMVCHGHATYQCLHCGSWHWTPEGVRFHMMTEHGEEARLATQAGRAGDGPARVGRSGHRPARRGHAARPACRAEKGGEGRRPMNDVEVPPAPCPRCGHALDRATDPFGDDATPEAGDVAICAGCGALLRFTDGLLLRAMTPQEEWGVRRESPEVARIERAIEAAKKGARP